MNIYWFYNISLCAFLFFIGGCKNKNEPVANTISKIIVTPKKIPAAEIKKYQSLFSQYFDTTLLKIHFNGAILVAKAGNIVYEKYSGLQGINKQTPVQANTPFHIASVSKTFTAVAILKLAEQNKILLSDSIQKYFPKLPYPGITVQMLLNHRSGLPNYLYFISELVKPIPSEVCNDDVINYLYKLHPPTNFKPNTAFNYCNTNFILLAKIIEIASGMGYSQFLNTHFFAPLQMSSTFVYTKKDASSIISFKYDGSIWQPDMFECTVGDKNICTTAQDLLIWSQALFTGKILSPATLTTAFTPYSNETPSIHNYGLGFRLLIFPDGKKIVYHFGKWHGFNAVFAHLVNEQADIIITGNRFTRQIYSCARQAYNFFGAYEQNFLTKAQAEDSNFTDKE